VTSFSAKTDLVRLAHRPPGVASGRLVQQHVIDQPAEEDVDETEKNASGDRNDDHDRREIGRFFAGRPGYLL
jgi:hypothetical protein